MQSSASTDAKALSEEEGIVEESLIQLSYSVDTLYFLVMGALVMFMAPGFAMLEAGMVSCLLYTSPSPRDATLSRMPSSA